MKRRRPHSGGGGGGSRRRLPAWQCLLGACLSLLLLLSSSAAATDDGSADQATSESGSSSIGSPHSAVIDLTSDAFDEYLSDPSNGLWFLKFYAPWCGHCKQLAPTLDKVAPYLRGTMAIGKVDCTREKSLCNRFDVQGYPTLIIFRDGDYFPYPGNRDADSIIEFAERMASNAVRTVATFEEALTDVADGGDDGVAFVAFDPAGSGSTLEEIMQSTPYLQVFQQAARKLQAEATFGLLDPGASLEEVQQFGSPVGSGKGEPGGKFIMKLERDADGKFFVPPGDVNTVDLVKYVRQHNVALVTELGPHNFRQMGEKEMPVAIAVTTSDDVSKSNELVAETRKFAREGDASIRYRYLYAKMDGKRWGKFLSQFSVDQEELPQLFVLNIHEKTYFQNATIVGVEKFLTKIAAGEIEKRQQEGGKGGFLKSLESLFVSYLPWSLYAIGGIFMLSFYFVLPDADTLEASVDAVNEATSGNTEKEEDTKKDK